LINCSLPPIEHRDPCLTKLEVISQEANNKGNL
jgi:hypothetical protein